MKKTPTLLLRDESDRRYVTDEVNPECAWVLTEGGVPHQKIDGTCVMLDEHGDWYARREVKPDKTAPSGFTLVELDGTTGKKVGWEPLALSAFAKHLPSDPDRPTQPGTYELIGPRINGNPEGVTESTLIAHADTRIIGALDKPHDQVSVALIVAVVREEGRQGHEGVVWHHPDGRRAKLKARDLR